MPRVLPVVVARLGIALGQVLVGDGNADPDQRSIREDWPLYLFKRLQIGDHVSDLIGLEPELRHGGMAGNDALGQGPLQVFNRIFEMQRAKRRRDRERALADLVDGVALRAMHANECQTSLRGRRLREDGLAGA